MLISKDLSNVILKIDDNSADYIANIFKSKLDNIIVTGFPLTDSFVYGYLKCLKLIIKILNEDNTSKEATLRYINELNLYCYNNYSCRTCFNKGFLKGIDQFKLELNEYSCR